MNEVMNIVGLGYLLMKWQHATLDTETKITLKIPHDTN